MSTSLENFEKHITDLMHTLKKKDRDLNSGAYLASLNYDQLLGQARQTMGIALQLGTVLQQAIKDGNFKVKG